MFSRRVMLAAGAAAFLLGMVAAFPARLAYAWFAPDVLRLDGVEGSLWNGRASAADIGGLYAAPLTWDLHPGSFLTGKLGARIEAELARGQLRGDVAVGPGVVVLRDVEATLALASLAGLLPVRGVEGRLSAELERARLESGWPVALIGELSVANLVYRPSGTNPLGNYRVSFTEEDAGEETLRGAVVDEGGALEVAGTLVLNADRSYELSGRVRARPEAPRPLADSLQFLGAPEADGMRRFALSGRL